MLLKRSISLLLAMMLITQPITILGSENANSSDVLLSVDAQVFSAVVPTQLPVWMSASGVITTAEDVSVTNTSKGPIRVDNIELTNVKADWELVNFDSDFSSFKVGSKKLAMSFNGDKSLVSGNIPLGASNLAPIDGLGNMPLNYDAKIPAQSTGLVDEIPANVVFTLKWHEVGSADIVDSDSGTPLTVGDNKLLTFTFTNVIAEDNSVVWSSSDESIATTVEYISKARGMFSGSKNCEVTAIGVGTATITGTLKDGTSASIDIVVSEKAEQIVVGTKYVEGNYEYSYGQSYTQNYYTSEMSWETVLNQNGWGVRVIDNTQTDYISPFSMIQGRPVTNMSWLFRLSPVTTLNLIDWDTSNVTNMYGMFSGSKATSLDVSSFDTSNVTNMRSMFSGNQATNLDLSSFDTSNVTDMSYMFSNSQATSLDLSSFDTSKVTNMLSMFYKSQATSLDLSSFDTSKVTNIRHMFYDSQLKNLTARTQTDSDRYKTCSNFPSWISVTIKS